MTPHVQQRPERIDDEAFLRSLYATTRADELAVTGWSDVQLSAFIDMQFEARQRDYSAHYLNAEKSILEAAGAPIGRLFLDRSTSEIRVVDIALVPEARGRGIATMLFEGIFEEARRKGALVSMHVEIFNPARRLYARLGFREVADVGPYKRIEWHPEDHSGREGSCELGEKSTGCRVPGL